MSSTQRKKEYGKKYYEANKDRWQGYYAGLTPEQRKRKKEITAQWNREHPEKHRQYLRKSAERHPNQRRKWNLRSHYRLTLEQYESLVDSQGGVCAICGGGLTSKANVDHDHGTGEVRGVLCGSCNTMLGMAKDDTRHLQSAINYLARRSI